MKPMKIRVLGTGCSTCKSLYELTQKAVLEMGLDNEVEYLTGQEGLQKIIEMGIMNSPVLTVNEKPILVGFTSDIEKIKKLIQEAE